MNYFRTNISIISYILVAGCVGGSGIGNGISKYSPIMIECLSCSLDSACAHEYFDSSPEWAGLFTLPQEIDTENPQEGLLIAELDAQEALAGSILPTSTTYYIDPDTVLIPDVATNPPNGETYIVVGQEDDILNIKVLNASEKLDIDCSVGPSEITADDFARAVFAEEGCGQALKTEFGFAEEPCDDTPLGCHQNSPSLLIFILNLLLLLRSTKRAKSTKTKEEPHAKI